MEEIIELLIELREMRRISASSMRGIIATYHARLSSKDFVSQYAKNLGFVGVNLQFL